MKVMIIVYSSYQIITSTQLQYYLIIIVKNKTSHVSSRGLQLTCQQPAPFCNRRMIRIASETAVQEYGSFPTNQTCNKTDGSW